jgi:hypothetical protein
MDWHRPLLGNILHGQLDNLVDRFIVGQNQVITTIVLNLFNALPPVRESNASWAFVRLKPGLSAQQVLYVGRF